MKKLLLFVLFFSLITNPVFCQKFYKTDEINVGWKYWADNYSWDYLIQNGVKLSYGFSSTFKEITATYLKENKFIVLTFSPSWERSSQLWLEGSYGTLSGYKLENLYDPISYVYNQGWFEIDFENIIYEPIFNRIMIPCGVDYNGAHNAICIDFVSPSDNVREATGEVKDDVICYDLSGRRIKVKNGMQSVFIQKRGNNSKKIFKKK